MLRKMSISEKINIGFSSITMMFVALMAWTEHSNSSAVENTTQTQQIAALNQKVDQGFAWMDKRLDRLESKVDQQGK